MRIGRARARPIPRGEIMRYKIKRIMLFPLVPTVVAAATLGTLAQGGIHAKSDDVRKAIVNVQAKFCSLFNDGDMRAVAGLYTEDSQLMAPNRPVITGRSAIRDFWLDAMIAGARSITTTTNETSGTGGDTTYETGSYVLHGEGGALMDEGKYVVIWRREGKAWYIHRDIWNSDRKRSETEE